MEEKEIGLPSKAQLSFILVTACCGIVGGIIMSALNGDRFLSGLGALAVSAGAGYLGVVWLNVDRSDWHRLIAAAVLCGMYPRPVFDAGKRFVETRQVEGYSAEVKSSAQALSGQSGAQLGNGIRAILEPAKHALQMSSVLENPVLLSKVNSDISFGVSEIGRVSNQQPEDAVLVFQELGAAAKQSRNTSVWQQVNRGLRQIVSDPQKPNEVRAQAKQAIAHIAL